MSAYHDYATTFTSRDHLVAALKDQGFTIECHNEAQPLLDYHDRPRPEKANIIIRRMNTGIGASNDIGFLRGADGKYTATISEYDRSCKFTDAWMGELKQAYTVNEQMAFMRTRGFQVRRETVKTESGRTQVRLECVRR